MNVEWFQWVVIPVLIMCARMVDVSIGTLRIIHVSRENARIAAVLGFFEVIIWLVAITQVLDNLHNWACFLAYGLGFAFGNIFGIKIERKLGSGIEIIRIINKTGLETLQMLLRDEGHGVTTVKGHGAKGDVNVIYVISEKKNTESVLSIINTVDPNSFVTVQPIAFHKHGYLKREKRILNFLRK